MDALEIQAKYAELRQRVSSNPSILHDGVAIIQYLRFCQREMPRLLEMAVAYQELIKTFEGSPESLLVELESKTTPETILFPTNDREQGSQC